MMSAPPFPFAVAIPTYRREASLLRAVRDVLAQTPAPAEVWVVDQSPNHTPATTAALAAWAEAGAIRWERLSRPNLPAARNHALTLTRCPVMFFLDDDVHLHPGLFAAHLPHYAEARVAAVSGRVQQAAYLAPPKPVRSRDPALRYLDFDFDSPTPRREQARVSGCHHSIRVETVRALGGYDEHFTGSEICEDVDLGVRLHRAGYDIVYEPAAVLDHLVETDGGCRAEARERPWEHARQRAYLDAYFLAKHFYPSRHYFINVWWQIPRRYVFNGRTLLRPWQLPRRLWELRQAIRAARQQAQAVALVAVDKSAAAATAN